MQRSLGLKFLITFFSTLCCFFSVNVNTVFKNDDVPVLNDVNTTAIRDIDLIDVNNYETLALDNYVNDDIIGTISIDGTKINETVVQGDDNEYYLTHNLRKNYDRAGAIFMDHRINLEKDKKILIYGHNSSTLDYNRVPFKELEKYYDIDYYKNHKYITLTINERIRIYEIFSVYIATSDFSYVNLNFDSTDAWYQHLIKLKNNSMYDTGVEIFEDDEVLILQTCSHHKDYVNYDKKYLIVVAKLINI